MCKENELQILLDHTPSGKGCGTGAVVKTNFFFLGNRSKNQLSKYLFACLYIWIQFNLKKFEAFICQPSNYLWIVWFNIIDVI